MKKTMSLILVLVSCCILAQNVWADPPTNDDCANADDVGILTEGTTVQRTGVVTDATRDCSSSNGPEVWVKFTIESCMDVTIDFCDYYDYIEVYSSYLHDECPCSEGISYDNSDYCGMGAMTFSWYGLSAGTYYYPIEAEGFTSSDYTINLSAEECAAPPANDNCSDATPIGEVSNLDFTTRGASNDGSGTCITSPNIWYVYTPSFSDTARLEITGADYSDKVAVYDGDSCSPLPLEIDCTQNSELDFEVLAAHQYLIEIGGVDDQSGTGRLTVDAIPETPPNDDCDNADDGDTLELEIPVQFTGTTLGATNDCMMYYWNAQVWIKFTVPSCMNVTIDYCDDENFVSETAEYLHTDCSCTETIYYSNYSSCTNGNPSRSWYDVSAGTYFYPVLANNDGGPYTVNVTGVECTPPPEPDFVVTAPYTGSSSTCGASNDCYILGNGEDYIYEVTIPEDGNWVFSLCNSEQLWDSYLYLGSSVCEDDLGSNQYACDNQHAEITAFGLEAGTYYLTIDCNYTGCGEYTLDIYTVPGPCDDSYYTNSEPDYEDGIYSYRDGDDETYAADDFTLAENVTIERIVFYATYDGDAGDTGDWLIMTDDAGVPGEIFFSGSDMDCDRVSTGNEYEGNDVYAYQFDDLDIELAAGSYFLACRAEAPESYWLTTDSQNGSPVYFIDDENTEWTLYEDDSDLAFCLFATTEGGGAYEYLPGDANMAAETWPAQTIGGDVTYLVNYFRGLADPCYLDGFYASADATGDCLVVGGDVTYLVNYFRGLADMGHCVDYEPAWPTPSDVPTDAPDGWPNCD